MYIGLNKFDLLCTREFTDAARKERKGKRGRIDRVKDLRRGFLSLRYCSAVERGEWGGGG